MKAPRKRFRCCRQCSIALLNRLVSTFGRCERARSRYQRAWSQHQKAALEYYSAPLRGRPPDEKTDAPPDEEGALLKPKSETKEQLDPTEALLLTQIIKRHTDGLPFQEGEFMAFGLAVFAATLARYRENFYEVIVGDSPFPAATAFIKGAAAAALALRSSGPGKN